jgi:hypothetical protein
MRPVNLSISHNSSPTSRNALEVSFGSFMHFFTYYTTALPAFPKANFLKTLLRFHSSSATFFPPSSVH